MFAQLVTYKVSRKSLNKFKKEGLNEKCLEALAKLEEQLFDSSEALMTRIQKFPQGTEILKHEALILKHTKGYFRLDKWIPHKTSREWVEALIFALVVATVVRTFLFAPFRIPSGSMLPTIQIGDHIFASMFSYGVPVPFTDVKISPKPIERGDIVIFPYPLDPSVDYIKRTVALEGETIQIIRNKVYINGKQLSEDYAYFNPQLRFRQAEDNVSNFGPVTVPEGHILVMGDNRYDSQDGRFWGYVEIKKVKGKAQIIYWSKDPGTALHGGNFIQGLIDTFNPTLIRTERLFATLK